MSPADPPPLLTARFVAEYSIQPEGGIRTLDHFNNREQNYKINSHWRVTCFTHKNKGMVMNIKILVFLFAVVLQGCSLGIPTQEETNAFNYGPQPSEDVYGLFVKEYLKSHLLDPDSAKYGCGPPKKGGARACSSYIRKGTESCGAYYGYIMLCMVNAKNAYGGYTGSERYYFMLENKPLNFWKLTNTSLVRIAE